MGELHAFAERIGLSQRAFDEDHYDVPAEFYDAAVEQGARPVSGSELIRILRGSGLRVPGVERSTRVVPVLRRLWQELRPQDPDLGEDLLARWGQEHRAYHTPVHLYECLQRLDVLTRSLSEEVLLAAWFHDAVYDGHPGADEEASAELARHEIGGALGGKRLLGWFCSRGTIVLRAVAMKVRSSSTPILASSHRPNRATADT